MSKTGVIFGGPAPEHDVSILTGLQAARELSRMGHDVVGLFWSKNAEWFQVSADLEGSAFIEGVPRGAVPLQLTLGADGGFVPQKKGLFKGGSALDVDVVVNCCHGGPGEDGGLQGALDLAGIAYTGPNGVGAAIGMDKFAFAGAVTAAGLPALPRVLLTQDLSDIGFEGPYIMKPRFGGSSIGIEIVDSLATAKALAHSSTHFRQGAVLEPYKPDSVDVNIGIRMFPTAQLSAIEKPIRSGTSARILDYKDKYIGGEGMVSAPREIPANIPDVIEKQLRDAALRVAEVCMVRGVQRLDFLLDGDDLYVNEINTIPGSLSKHLWVQPDVSFATLLGDMIAEAKQRPATFWNTSGADGAVLRSSGSIAAKLS
jgi:D-alanine-D-alanine ligase